MTYVTIPTSVTFQILASYRNNFGKIIFPLGKVKGSPIPSQMEKIVFAFIDKLIIIYYFYCLLSCSGQPTKGSDECVFMGHDPDDPGKWVDGVCEWTRWTFDCLCKL